MSEIKDPASLNENEIDWSVLHDSFGGAFVPGEIAVTNLDFLPTENPEIAKSITDIFNMFRLTPPNAQINWSGLCVIAYAYRPDSPYDSALIITTKPNSDRNAMDGLPGSPTEGLENRAYLSVISSRDFHNGLYYNNCLGNHLAYSSWGSFGNPKARRELARVLINNFSPRKP